MNTPTEIQNKYYDWYMKYKNEHVSFGKVLPDFQNLSLKEEFIFDELNIIITNLVMFKNETAYHVVSAVCLSTKKAIFRTEHINLLHAKTNTVSYIMSGK